MSLLLWLINPVSQAYSAVPLNSKLASAADQLDGVSRNLCSFVSKDLLPEGSTQKDLSAIGWMKVSKSIYSKDSSVSPEALNKAIQSLQKTQIGSALLEAISKQDFAGNNYPISLHTANPKDLIGSDIPMAFSSVIRLNDSDHKSVPFIVFSPKVKGISDSKLVMIFANELYDILGRMNVGDDLTVTSEYQALGIVLSDVILKKQLMDPNNAVVLSKDDVIAVYRKSLGYYSSFFPGLKYQNLTSKQRLALDNLTSLSTNGVFSSFRELESFC